MKFRSKSIFHIYALSALLASLLGSALTVPPVYAAGITVNTTDDELNSDGDCSLREAINAANTNSTVDACTAGSTADTITLPAGTYTLTITGAGEDANATGDLDITSSLTINGASAASTIIQAGATPGSGIDRVFHVVAAVAVNISGLTIANGQCPGCGGGGLLINDGTLTVTNSVFANNSGTYGAGLGVYSGTTTITNSSFLDNISDSNGGGLLNAGTMTVTNSTFSGNSAGAGGGIYSGAGTLIVTNSTVSNNSVFGVDGWGGGLFNQATLHLKNTILANNTNLLAPGTGKDCYDWLGGDFIATNINNLIEDNGPSGHMCGTPSISTDPGLGVLGDNGGPTQTFSLPPSSIALGAGTNTGCPSTDQRGVTRPQNGTCDIGAYESNAQPGPTFVVNTNEDSTDGFCDAYVAGVTDCTLREAITYGNSIGGTDTITFAANYTITLASQLPEVTDTMIINGNAAASTIIQANAAPDTATYRVFEVGNTGNLTLDSLTVQNGRCNGSCVTNGNNGGGILNNGTLTLINSVISDNHADGMGGGIFNFAASVTTVTNSTFVNNSANSNGGGVNNNGSMTLTNSTFSGNSASSSGGGIFGGFDNLSVTNSTFSANSAGGNGGGIYNQATLNLKNNVLANSVADGDCYNQGGDTIATDINNLIVTNGPSGHKCGTPILNSNPNLGSLTGSPAYFPLNTGSPAINAGDDAVCAAVPVNNTSQNDVTRPQGAHCDIGSFEAAVTTITNTVKSVNTNDGWILESTETSGKGGTLNSTATNFLLGDDLADRQYRALLHFDTSFLPDTAVITSATLKIKKQGQSGSNPFSILGNLRVDMRKPAFGTAALALTDFKSAAGQNNVSTFGVTPIANWYSAILNGTGNSYVNRAGTTQFRLYFTTDDNNDNGNDFMKFYSGNAGVASRPQLVIEYYVP